MDVVNVDFKVFIENFYYKFCVVYFVLVFDMLVYLYYEIDCWVEIIMLFIFGQNDSLVEINEFVIWVECEFGCDVLLYFIVFYFDWKMISILEMFFVMLVQVCCIVLEVGLYYVYIGNVYDMDGGIIYCLNCYVVFIVCNWYDICCYDLIFEGYCLYCQIVVVGCFGL